MISQLLRTSSRFVVSISVSLFFTFLGDGLGDGVHAAPIDLSIATEYEVNPDTGIKVPAALNPSGKADLTYFNNGVVLTFAGRDGRNQSIRIHLDFGSLLNTEMKMRAEATAVYDKIMKEGPGNIGLILQKSAEYAKASNQTMALMIDSHRTVGFTRSDFDLGHVRLVTSDGDNQRLQRMVGALFIPSNLKVPEKPEAKAPTGVASCERSFVSTKGSANGSAIGAKLK